MVRIQHWYCCSLGSVPGEGTEILQAAWHGQNLKQQQQQKEFPGSSVVRLGSSTAMDQVQSREARLKKRNSKKIGNPEQEDEKIVDCINNKRSEN